jgi:hypothetical protein
MSAAGADPVSRARAAAWAKRQRAIAAGAEARGPDRVDRAPDVDRIAAAAAPENARDATIRRLALEATQRRGAVRDALEAAEDHVTMLASRAAYGQADLDDVVEALRARDEARLQWEAVDRVARHLEASPVLAGRR